MRSALRDKVADLLMEAIRHPEHSVMVFWLGAYCRLAREGTSPLVPFARWADFVNRHKREIRWCRASGEAWGRKLVADSGLFRSDAADAVTIAPQYLKDLSTICEKAAAYWTYLKEMHRRSSGEGLSGLLEQASLLWRHRLFFEFHELLEEVWMDWRGPERRFLQGLIQLGVAFYHIQRNNYRGAMSMFRNGVAKVAPHAPRYADVELTRFLKRIDTCRQQVARLGPGRSREFYWGLLPEVEVASPAGRKRAGTNNR